MTVTLVVWLPLAWLLSRVPRWRGCARCALFVLGYLWCETLGLLFCLWLWLGHRLGSSARVRYLERNFALQCWWAGTLKRLAQRLFRLRFEVSGEDALAGGGVIFVPRHTSMGDTVVPIVFYARPRQRRLRFVLKRALLFDPCLDVVGHRLPNYFADRSAVDSAREVLGVVALLEDLAPGEGVLIYPEGTRFSVAKRQRIMARLEGEAADRAARWPHLLPPRYGGILAMLARNPGLDLLFCAHVGFEGGATFASLINGAWLDATIRIRFWRVPYAEIPCDPAAQRPFFDGQWQRMSDTVEALTL